MRNSNGQFSYVFNTEWYMGSSGKLFVRLGRVILVFMSQLESTYIISFLTWHNAHIDPVFHSFGLNSAYDVTIVRWWRHKGITQRNNFHTSYI